jgi:hypothetical protein
LGSNKRGPDWDLLLFGSIAIIAAPVVYYEFLQMLSYLTRQTNIDIDVLEKVRQTLAAGNRV